MHKSKNDPPQQVSAEKPPFKQDLPAAERPARTYHGGWEEFYSHRPDLKNGVFDKIRNWGDFYKLECDLGEKIITTIRGKYEAFDRYCFPAFDSKYTGLQEEYLGGSHGFNTSEAAQQLVFALFVSAHPLVLKLLDSDVTPETFNPEPLREAHVLKHMKILDLGCGGKPTFARTARRLGADVYTVDVCPSNDLLFCPALFSQSDRELETARHVQLDLNAPDSAERIVAVSGDGFDLVTSAWLKVGWDWDGLCKVAVDPAIRDRVEDRVLKELGLSFHIL